MPSKDEALKPKLMAKAEAAIEKMLKKETFSEKMSLSEIEAVITEAQKEIGEGLLGEMLEVQELAQKPVCPSGGGDLRKKGKRRKQVLTVHGESQIEREYYQCLNCRAGIFPLDEQLARNATVYSPSLAKQIVWLSALLPYEQCEAVFERIAGRSIPSSSIWRQGQFYSEKLWDYAQAQAEQVRVERIQFADARHDHRQKKGMSMDGGMVNIRQEGWRELKVGAVFDIEMRLERPKPQADLLEMAHGVNVHYTAVLSTKDAFSPLLWALAVKHELPTARERAIRPKGRESVVSRDSFKKSLNHVPFEAENCHTYKQDSSHNKIQYDYVASF